MPHKHQIFSAVAFALLLSACTPSDALAQADQEKNAAQGTSEPQVARAKLILADATKAMSKLKAFSYVAHSETFAPATSVFSAEVCGQRIEPIQGASVAGGQSWKLHCTGTVTGAAASGGDAKKFIVANDGAASRSISAADKSVVEREDDNVGEIFSFFANFAKDAHETVFWEFLTDDALIKNHEFVNVTALEAPQTIDGKVCDAVYFGADPAKADTKPETKKDPKDEASTTTYVKRVFIARDDNLPRRIERLNVDKDGKTITGRTLEVRSLKINDDAELAAFTLDVPDGYRVKAAKLTRSAAKGEDKADDAALAGPKGVTWTHDKKLLKIGADAPDFTLKDPEGKAVSLKDFKGKVVVLDFWATWCRPCVTAMPALQRLHDKYKDKNVVIIGMNAEMQGNGDPVKFKKDKGYTYKLLLKAEPSAQRYKVSGLPTFYVISPEAKIVWGGSGLKAPPNKQNAGAMDVTAYLEEQLSTMIDAELEKAGK